jgi:hypothetical protein
MMYLKITVTGVSDALTDDDSRMEFKLVQIADDETVTFSKVQPEGASQLHPVALVHKKGDAFVSEYPLTGMAYLMNDQGKTIARHAGF